MADPGGRRHREDVQRPSSFQSYAGSPSENYERYFVPAIGAPLAGALIEFAELQPGERVIDVACGTGVVARLAASAVEPSGSVLGLDVNPGMVAVARAVGPPAIEWHGASAQEMPFPDESFDVALCQMGLQFFENKPAALHEIRRVLSPGGRLAVSLPGPTPEAFDLLAASLARHVAPELAGFVKVVFSLHDERELRTLLEAAGFNRVSTAVTTRALRLPPPADFLWQYVHSTPLVTGLARASDRQRTALEDDVVAAWQPYTQEGALVLEVSVTHARAHSDGSL